MGKSIVKNSSGGSSSSSRSNVVSLISRVVKFLDKLHNLLIHTKKVVISDKDIICEILSRLPVKSLMRLKCVCKTWLSMIEDDPYFADLHFERSKESPGLLFVFPLRTNLRPRDWLSTELFLAANLSGDRKKAEIYITMETNFFINTEMLQPVNGLICFVGSPSFFYIRIYNISTRKVTSIKPSLPIHRSHYSCTKRIDFGFDPITKKYKLLCVSHMRLDQYTVCEVLTVGDNAWRRIDAFPPCNVAKTSVYVNGFIYYCTSKFEGGNWDNNDDAALVAFDVGSEKFRMIPIPILILNSQPSGRNPTLELIEVAGHVAICCKMSSNIVKLWVYREYTDYDNKGKKTKTSRFGNCEENWSEDTITLPFPWDNYRRWYFYTGAGTQQILLKSHHRVVSGNTCATFYSYDLEKKTFTEIEVNGIPSSIPEAFCIELVSTFVESLFPIQKQRCSSDASHSII